MKKYNKLVRDNIPDIIRAKGEPFVAHPAKDDIEYEEKLHEKLKEEIDEFLQNKSADEIADVLEVLDALAAHHKISKVEIAAAKEKKVKKNGSFSKRIILDEA